jgi:hypothetical protein
MGNAIAIGIDTHSFVKKPVNSRFTEKQAEVQSDTIFLESPLQLQLKIGG